jgi:imidazoleglycerol-phosphate dehydratase
MLPRSATVKRDTKETRITVTLNLDGTGRSNLNTGLPFLDHMLDQVARHGMFDLDIEAQGDLHIDAHHTVEDVGITLGQAFTKALSDKRGIRRYGQAYVPFDLFYEFFQGFINHALVTLHIDNLHGRNSHHIIETVFKAFGRALRMAVECDPRMEGILPSTKGSL